MRLISLLFCATTALSTQATGAAQQTSRNDECVVWYDYNLPSATSFARYIPKETVRTERYVACRVHESLNDVYEFGTMNLLLDSMEAASSTPSCHLHRDPLLLHPEFQIAVRNETMCDHFWAPLAYDVDPLGPNIVQVGVQAPELKLSPDVAVCRYHQQPHDSEFVIGRMVLQGKFFGHCGYISSETNEEVFVGGDFDALSAIPRVKHEIAECNDKVDNHRWTAVFDQIQQRVDRYLSQQDKDLIASVSGHAVKELLEDLNNIDIVSFDMLDRVLSTDRFIAHDVLNEKGLSLLRAVLAEQMTLARRRYLGLAHHVDTVEWERNGMLLKDFDYYTNQENLQEFEELLNMVAASFQTVSASTFQWVERNVTTVTRDPQREPHIDTFHSVVKMWVYERGVVTDATGPLHYMRGSNRNTKGKLQWIYNMSLPPATEAIREPSLRYRASPSFDDLAMPDVLRPVLPLDEYRRTLVIADTSGIHHRGNAIPGTVRKTIRVSNGHDGGLPRLNPYVWDGWETGQATKGHEDARVEGCLDPRYE